MCAYEAHWELKTFRFLLIWMLHGKILTVYVQNSIEWYNYLLFFSGTHWPKSCAVRKGDMFIKYTNNFRRQRLGKILRSTRSTCDYVIPTVCSIKYLAIHCHFGSFIYAIQLLVFFFLINRQPQFSTPGIIWFR